MPNITSIGAGLYTSLAYCNLPVIDGIGSAGVNVGRGDTGAKWTKEFELRTDAAPGDGIPIIWVAVDSGQSFGRIREFPNLGIPANIVNVPQYGQASSSQVVGQSDPPNLDFTFNYVPSVHYFIDDMRAAGTAQLFRVRLSNGEGILSAGDGNVNPTGGTDQAGSAAALVLPYEYQVGTDADMREFSDFYFFGAVASFEIVPSLTDANQLNVSLTIQGQLSGPWSYTTGAAAAVALTYAEAPAA